MKSNTFHSAALRVPRRRRARHSRAPKPAMPAECGVCYSARDDLQTLRPCHHRLCKRCAAQILQMAKTRAQHPLCPFCRSAFTVSEAVPSLEALCVRKLAKKLPRPEALARLPDEPRAQLLHEIASRGNPMQSPDVLRRY